MASSFNKEQLDISIIYQNILKSGRAACSHLIDSLRGRRNQEGGRAAREARKKMRGDWGEGK